MKLKGKPNRKQAEFFASTARFTAYGGARGGGKSWALRRKLIALCLRWPGIRCLIIRRTLSELRQNHVLPLQREIGREVPYSAGERVFRFRNGSTIWLGYLTCDADTLRYQGQEYDIIAVDEATQITEYQFATLKGCLRGIGDYPRRMYLTCNPGGVGHSWVKRLFIDRAFHDDEDPGDYRFIQALVTDNDVIMKNDPGYVEMLKSLPDTLKSAWLDGKWDLFEGQFFSEFRRGIHTSPPKEIPVRAASARRGRRTACRLPRILRVRAHAHRRRGKARLGHLGRHQARLRVRLRGLLSRPLEPQTGLRALRLRDNVEGPRRSSAEACGRPQNPRLAGCQRITRE